MAHRFLYKDENYWMVACDEKGGEFSTKIWYKDGFAYGKCPCCHKIVTTARKK
jgi:hypothetical protein